jgi:hypothetical protein
MRVDRRTVGAGQDLQARTRSWVVHGVDQVKADHGQTDPSFHDQRVPSSAFGQAANPGRSSRLPGGQILVKKVRKAHRRR